MPAEIYKNNEQQIVQKHNRRDLLLIIGSIVFVILAATLVYKLADSGKINLAKILGTSNRGTLINPPRSMSDITLFDEQGKTVSFSSLGNEWIFLVASDGVCQNECKDTLYLTRQLRTALGADSVRVHRILLSHKSPLDLNAKEFIKNEHENLSVLYVTKEEFDKLFLNAKPSLDPLSKHAFFVVDPQGWMMMAYDQTNTYKDVIKDMKFLLKYSAK